MHRCTELGLGHVARRVVAQTWPLQVLTAAMLLAACGWYVGTGDPMPARAAWRLETIAAVGLAGGFAVHEVAHVAVLRRCAGVSHLVVSSTWWRFSLEPRGSITAAQVVGVALAGPGAAAAVGLVLWAALPGAGLHGWFLVHLVFLLPVFGDGRSLVLGVRELPWRVRAT